MAADNRSEIAHCPVRSDYVIQKIKNRMASEQGFTLI
ncbi:MAG: hypothetical protein QOJ35_3458, partial [Solirubrobacteraceae bacterium]|nr:hypothetical protein [Solirubrobacteraceae bacterium]